MPAPHDPAVLARIAGRVPPDIRDRLAGNALTRRFARLLAGGVPPTSGPVPLASREARGVRLDLRLPDEVMFWTMQHEREVVGWLLGRLNVNDVFYDVGAHIGYLSLLAAARGSRVVAFEPFPAHRDRLLGNLRLNPQLDSLIHIEPVALGAQPGRAQLRVCDDGNVRVSETGRVEVPMLTLDDFVRAGTAPPPTGVKVDVDGSEGAVLAGMSETLSKWRPLVVVEVHDRANADAVFQALKRADYEITLPGGEHLGRAAQLPIPSRGAMPHILAVPRPAIPRAEAPLADRRRLYPESRFTAAHGECETPELWLAPDAASSEHEVTVFLRALVRLTKPRLVVETGSFHGFTTVALASALRDNRRGRVVSLELDPGAAAVARGRLEEAGLSNWASVEVTSSMDWTPPGPIDLTFLDAGSGWHRAREFIHLRPHMHGASLVLVHDTATKNRLPRRSFEALARMGLLAPVWISSPRGLLVAQPRWPSSARRALGLPRYGLVRFHSGVRALAASTQRRRQRR